MKIAGVTLPETLQIESRNFVLNGAGVRKELLIKMYVGGLYLLRKEKDPLKIIEADEPMAIRMHIVFTLIPKELMAASMNKGFKKATNGNVAPIKSRIDKILSSSFFENLHGNEVLDLVYVPGNGVICYKNGKVIDSIPGLDFKKILFAIWLGNRPVTEDLKRQMLGMMSQ